MQSGMLGLGRMGSNTVRRLMKAGLTEETDGQWLRDMIANYLLTRDGFSWKNTQ